MQVLQGFDGLVYEDRVFDAVQQSTNIACTASGDTRDYQIFTHFVNIKTSIMLLPAPNVTRASQDKNTP